MGRERDTRGSGGEGYLAEAWVHYDQCSAVSRKFIKGATQETKGDTMLTYGLPSFKGERDYGKGVANGPQTHPCWWITNDEILAIVP